MNVYATRAIVAVLAVAAFGLLLRVLVQASALLQPGIYWITHREVMYPEGSLTPGDVFTVADAHNLCSRDGARRSEALTLVTKNAVTTAYHVDNTNDDFEIDWLIPAALGGRPTMRNLWPQALHGRWNARVKNRVEMRLYEMVCNRAIRLDVAQRALATDWIEAYKFYLGYIPSEEPYTPKLQKIRLENGWPMPNTW